MTIDLKTSTDQPVATVEAENVDGKWMAQLDNLYIEIWNLRFDVKAERNWSKDYARVNY